MILEFLGNCPRQKYFRLGIIGNNRVDNLIILIDKIQDNIDLSTFTPSIKMQNKDLSFMDKTTDFDIEAKDEKIKITYLAPDKVTKQKSVDMQVVFEKPIDDDILVWQTQVFNITFDISIDVSTPISNEYPDVLKDLEKQINDISAATERIVTQYESKAHFPNVGQQNAIYIDCENNKAYRYDIDDNYYYCVGSDYEDIKTINCNGGII